MKDSLLNRSIQQSQSQSQMHASNSSILFNNSVVHPLQNMSIAGISQASFVTTSSGSGRHRNSLYHQNRPFEYLPNPTIAQCNHSSLLKDSQIMKKFSHTKQEKLSSIHTSTRHPHLNIFVRNEGEYDNMTYQAKRSKHVPFIPSEPITTSASAGATAGAGPSRVIGPFKFQLTKKQYFESIENLPRANFNPFHLVPDINPTQQDLITTAAPIYTKLPLIYQSHMLDCSALKKDKDCSVMSSSMAGQNISLIAERKLSQTIDAKDSIEEGTEQNNNIIESLGDQEDSLQLETQQQTQKVGMMNYDQSAIDAAVDAAQDNEENENNENNIPNQLEGSQQLGEQLLGENVNEQRTTTGTQVPAEGSQLIQVKKSLQQSQRPRASNMEENDETQSSILLTLPRMSGDRVSLPKVEQSSDYYLLQQSNQQNQVLKSKQLQQLSYYANEFDLQALRQVKLSNTLAEQTNSITEFARNHPPNFVSKAELAQLAKCVILNASNSPTELKAIPSISLGRSTQELLRISKFEDRAYFERVTSKDKLDLSKLTGLAASSDSVKYPANSSGLNTSHSNPTTGVRQFGRISQGLVKPFDPNENFKYTTTQSVTSKNPAKQSIGFLSVKKQNIIRNVASFNHLSHSCKAVQQDYLESIDQGYVRPTENLKKRPSRFFMPNYMADKQDKIKGPL